MLTHEDLYQRLRSKDSVQQLTKQIWQAVEGDDQPFRIMEVCGGHTYAIVKYGLDQLLPSGVKFIHGPGCPVCVLPQHRIDAAIQLARRPETILVTLGDMIRVPGSRSSLQQTRAEGADVRFVYSPLETIQIARDNPDRQVIYYAIGFETTTPMTALLIDQARHADLNNLCFHTNHVLIPPAMNLLMEQGANIDAFLAPGHVSVITGVDIYEPIVKRFGTPVVISGFEPVDILSAVLSIIRQLKKGLSCCENNYARSVRESGNQKARDLVDRYFELRSDFLWRGIGSIPESALQLKPEFAAIDAERAFAEDCPQAGEEQSSGCICGAILCGHASPLDCSLFAGICTPQRPQGSCMVSNEGACAAYYRYRRTQS
ncbi:MAG: hydrogenase formation protein HypD [Desulfuromonadales bacterium]|nr:hydrogenase formation protein HypD [Desulfuromonadales bacterium]MBN2791854.1 hydrogenase formation protein HypD [Desulfuromonadales bacterium]